MRKTFKPNRPIRVGTKMLTTDDNGAIPEKAVRKPRRKASKKTAAKTS